MKKVKFDNLYFYYGIISFFCLLILINSYVVFLGSKLSFIPLFIQIVLLLLIYTKHQFTKVLLKVFSILFLIIGSALQLIPIFINYILDASQSTDIKKGVISLLSLFIGILILLYTNKTVRLIESNDTN